MEEKRAPKRKASKTTKKAGAGSSKVQKKDVVALWCLDCWTRPSASCSKGKTQHRLVEQIGDAEAVAKSALFETNTEIERLQAKLKEQQERLYALDALLEENRTVLQLEAEPCETEDGIEIDGGDFKIVLAADLTSEEIKTLCSTLEGLDFSHDEKISDVLPPSFDADIPESIFKKLPVQPPDGVVREGTVLVTSPAAPSADPEAPKARGSDEEGSESEEGSDEDKDKDETVSGEDEDVSGGRGNMDLCNDDHSIYRFRIYPKSVKPRVVRETRVFGRVKENLRCILIETGDCCFDKEKGGGFLKGVRVV